MSYYKDEHRYIDKVRDSIKNKLRDVVNKSDILTSPPSKKYKFRIPLIDVPKFTKAGQGTGGNGKGPGDGKDNNPSNESGDYIWVEVSLEEITDLIFETLKLPTLPKGEKEPQEKYRREGTTRLAPLSRLDIRKTALEWEKRGVLDRGALRYKDLRLVDEPVSSAVVIFARDSSGSMDEDRRYKSKVASLWTLLWLRRIYSNVQVHFIVHDTKALEVSEEEFFHLHSSGGTMISSAWLLAKTILNSYPKESWNRYIIYFSDGEDWSEDIPILEQIVKELVKELELAVYGEIVSSEETGWLLRRMRNWGVKSAVLQDVRKWLEEIFGNEH